MSLRRLMTGSCLALAVLLATSMGCGRGASSEAEPEAKPKAEPEQPQQDEGIAFQAFSSLSEALSHIGAIARAIPGAGPLVLGVGEFHQTTDSAPVRPAIERFIDAVDVWSGGASDLIVETWIEEGNCGKAEAVVSTDVRETTKRPPVIENHLTRLVTGARARGVQPHALTMRCEDYASVLGPDGAVDYEKMLLLIRRKLGERATEVTLRRRDAGGRGVIVLYGGALHNDRQPTPGLEDLSYAPEVLRAAGDRYIEIDLYVPEYVAGNALVTGEPWYPLLAREAAADKVLVIERGPGSYVVILRKDERAKAGE